MFNFFSMIFGAQSALSEDAASTSPLSYSVTTDFAFYPKSDYVKGDTHFAPLTAFTLVLKAGLQDLLLSHHFHF